MDLDTPQGERSSVELSDAPTELAQAGELNGMSDLSTQSPDGHLWGMLKPMGGIRRSQLDFWRISPIVKIGSASDNQIVLNHKKISPYHCIFEWDGKENYCVRDLSDTGTYVSNNLIGKGRACIVKDGQEVSFGSPYIGLDDDMQDDYRFVYRHVVHIPPPKGMLLEYDVASEQLGEGAMGRVVRVMHRRSAQWRAAKRIKPGKLRPRKGLSGLDIAKREITVMKGLKHPNICKIFDYYIYEEDNTLDIVMELVDGPNLRDYALDTDNGLPELTVKHIAYQICTAMKYVHDQGITHRDLTPPNILVLRRDPPIIKIADFGAAKFVDDSTALLSACGTVYFVAPEMVRSLREKGECTTLVDSFSLGAVLYYCLTLSIPFLRVKPAALDCDLEMHIKARKGDLTALEGRDLTKDVIDVIKKLLSQTTLGRPTMAKVLLHAWFKGYQPPHTFPPEAYEAEEKEVMRELSKTPRRNAKGKGRSIGRALNLATIMEQEAEERAESTPAGRDVEMALATPMKNKKAAMVLRRSNRINKTAHPKRFLKVEVLLTPRKWPAAS